MAGRETPCQKVDILINCALLTVRHQYVTLILFLQSQKQLRLLFHNSHWATLDSWDIIRLSLYSVLE